VETLSIYKRLWATFDLLRMAMGISLCALGVILLCFVMKILLGEDAESQPVPFDFAAILKNVLVGSLLGLVCSPSARIAGIGSQEPVDSLLFTIAIGGIIGAFTYFLSIHGRFRRLKAPSLWSWLGIIFVVGQSAGFASNSYTIWEDNILLFFLSTFAIVAAAHSLRQDNKFVRIQGVCYSILFADLGRITFYSQRCREEQMPTCHTTYFGATGSVAAIENLIPLTIAVALPLVIKPYLPHPIHQSGVAKNWVSWGLQFGLVLNASYWFLNSIDNADWFDAFSKDSLKTLKVRIAQFQLVLGFSTGIAAFIWRAETASIAEKSRSRVQSRHEMNAVRARYLYLLAAFLLPALLVQEPLGAGSLFLFFCQIISLAEILHTNSLQNHPVGPIMLGILGSFHFFRTGHQATLSSIQWRSAFIAFHNLSYPGSPFLVMLNTFGAQILVAIAVPLIPLWRSEGEVGEAGLVSKISGSVAAHLLYHGAICLSTMVWAGLLRRHLMLYRVFCPRFMMSAVVLLVVDVVSIGISLNGARWSISSGRTRGAG
jgi:phosphatidylinositol glycan class O